ncbi:MAG: ABC transporter permease, partial [Candidatus Adiutrix sp.]
MKIALLSVPNELTAKLWLIWTLAVRGYSQHYKGSLLGYLWPYISMLVMLLIYSMVFSVIFNARWQQLGVDTPLIEVPFWIILLAGQLMYQLMSEIMNQGPSLVLAVPNYVKKIKFPLEILPIISFLGLLFN